MNIIKVKLEDDDLHVYLTNWSEDQDLSDDMTCAIQTIRKCICMHEVIAVEVEVYRGGSRAYEPTDENGWIEALTALAEASGALRQEIEQLIGLHELPFGNDKLQDLIDAAKHDDWTNERLTHLVNVKMSHLLARGARGDSASMKALIRLILGPAEVAVPTGVPRAVPTYLSLVK
ncbi:hypothetical protein [Allohahella marinimesophila]|uniref:Uncharacterized protein n=1 Tax=Allohahella marinimesophila TaxID=1054972 RepID=A0ABP7NUM4_9GAMM